MLDLSDPETALLVAGLIVLNTLILGGLLALFRPGEYGFFAQHGFLIGWAICFGVSVYFNMLGLLRLPFGISFGISVVMWWLIALKVFGLSLRQTIKLNIAQAVIFVLLLFGIAAVVGG